MRMKSLRFLPLTLMMLVAEATMAETVDLVKARQAATTFLNNNGVQTTGLTDVTPSTGFSNVFVFTTENSYVLMAADDRVQPILGYSLTGRFDFENMPDNKRAWIQGYCNEIQYAKEHQTSASADVTRQWRELAEGNPNTGRAASVVTPLMQTQWSQGDPYNMLCPGGSVTGCVATAMAQIMKYWNYPEHGIGSHTYTHATYGELTADFQSTTYDWTNMTNTYDGSNTYTQKMAVATLMYHCGVSVDMNYSPNSSGAGDEIVASALKNYFNYSSETVFHNRSEYTDDNVWINMLKDDLNVSRPVWYCGSGSGGGHAFVFDGYNNDNYFHVNWGWGGYCDEYYSISSLNPGPNGPGSGSTGIYNDAQGAVFGIHPSECSANVPSNLIYSQNGRNVTLSWSEATGAYSYKVYRNNNFIGNASSTSFPDVAPFGSSVYYVRSVDSQGRLSLSSNAVTVSVEYLTPVVDDLTATVSGHNVNLSWTAPDWCYPETPSATLSYGEGNIHYSWTSVYYAHRYLAADLAQYANKWVYKVATYVQYPGTYSAYVYTNSTSYNQPAANSCAMSKVGIEVSSTGWFEFEADEPIILSSGHDLWVVMKQENTGQTYPTPSFNLSSHNTNAFYAGSNSPTSLYDADSNYNCAWLIKAYITDGTYTYNIYRNGSSIANNVSSTNYNDNNLTTGIYNYYVKTNYYAGETAASNQVSVQIGTGTPYTISASATPGAGGTVAGTGSYFSGQTCTLRAIASEGFYFVNWTKDGVVVSTNATYSFTVTRNATYVANFNSPDLHVFAEYYPDASNPNSQYVRVYWTEPTLGKGNPSKADRSTYSVYRAYCDGGGEELIAENVTGNQYIDYGWSALEEGSYKYGVSVVNRRGDAGEIQWQHDTPVALNSHTLDAAGFANPVVNSNTLDESSSMNHRDGWLYYDNGTYATNVGLGGSNTMYWSTMFPASMLTENRLTKIALYENSYNTGTITLSVYNGGNNAPGTLLYTQAITPVGAGFHEITLSSPVTIDPAQNLWIVFYQSGDTYPACACIDEGNANNRWVSPNGSSWYDLANSGLPGYGWMIRAYVEEVAETVWSDCIEKQGAVQQTLTLDAGWNWFSSYVEADDLLEQLEESLGENGLVIASSLFTTEYDDGEWFGDLDSEGMRNSEMYMILTNGEATVQLLGTPTTPSSHPITINPGWNWIGFPCDHEVSLEDALAIFPAEEGDMIASTNSSTEYDGEEWFGGLETFAPGQGYMLYSNSAKQRTLVFQIANISKSVSKP